MSHYYHKKFSLALLVLLPLAGHASDDQETLRSPAVVETHMLSRAIHFSHNQNTADSSAQNVTTSAANIDSPGGTNSNLEPYQAKSIIPKLKVNESVTPDTTDLLGEKIDLNTGSVSFHQTDIRLPGNSALEVAIRRVYRGNYWQFQNSAEFGDWKLSIPNISTTLMTGPGYISGAWGQGQECSGSLNPGPFYAGGTMLESYQYWNGDSLNVPGQINEKLLTPSSHLLTSSEVGIYRRVTKSNWRISCFDRYDENNVVVGEGFRAEAPNGDIYTFDQLRLVEAKPSGNKRWGGVVKYNAFMLVSKVVDRFGNWVRYHYDDGYLTRITANDGRTITLEYNDPSYPHLVTAVTANNREWEYNYVNEYSDRQLRNVILPNGQSWTYTLAPISKHEPNPGNESLLFCGRTPDSSQYKGTIIHPNGMTGEFYVQEVIHGETNVLHYPNQWGNIPECFSTMSLVSKSLSGDGLDTELTWHYDYSQNIGTFSTDTTASSEARLKHDNLPYGVDAVNNKTTTITAPDGSKSRYFYNRDWSSASEGSLTAVQNFDTDGFSLLKSKILDYQKSPSIGSTHMNSSKTNSRPHRYRLDLVSENIVTTHSDGETHYLTEYSDYNLYGKPGLKKESGPSGTKYTKYEFINDRANWTLNLPTKVSISANGSSYSPIREKTYKSLSQSNEGVSYDVLVPHQNKVYGTWRSRYSSYHSNGNVKEIEYNQPLIKSDGQTFSSEFRYKVLSAYHRGQPQHITVPSRYSSSDTMSASRVVDDNGWVTNVTDFNGNSYGYGYDVLGRLLFIDLPNDANQWLDTYFQWSDEPGFATTRTAMRCELNSARTGCGGSVTSSSELRFDALMRNILTIKTDRTTNNQRYQRKMFDAYNQETFVSHWSDYRMEKNGLSFEYDGLNRMIKEKQSGLDGKFIDYLSDNTMRRTDGEGNVTRTRYRAFGSPSYEQAVVIDSPENVRTELSVNIFGDITAITQSGPLTASQTEYRAYDESHNLCKVSRPDVGVSVYTHNALGEPTSRAEGVASASVNSCISSGADDKRIQQVADNVGDVWQVDYPEEGAFPSPDKVYKRDNNGNLQRLETGSVVQTYSFNSLGQPTAESLAVNSRHYTVQYGYNRQGDTSYFTYPDGYQVHFGPNGFGEPTGSRRVKSGEPDYIFADEASYYPNGMLSGFTYGNGLVHEMTLDTARQVPTRLNDSGDNATALDYQFGYDDNLNIVYQHNLVNSDYTLTQLAYDGLDRLLFVNGGAGVGTSELTYDGLGNIRSYHQSLSDRELNYHYSDSTNRLSAVDGAGSAYDAFTYDARGNVTDNGTRSFTYNRANQLVQSGDIRYRYDGHNRRVMETRNGSHRYSFYRLDGTLVYRETEAGSINYVYLGDKLIAKDGYIPEDSGTQHYQPFGESIEGAVDDVGYTGHRFDADTGLVYMQARYYDPVIGRFYSNDPKGTASFLSEGKIQGFNRYAYAANNPYKYVDPDGRDYEETFLSLKVPFVGAVDVGTVGFKPNASGQGNTTSGLFVRFSTSASNVDSDVTKGVIKQKGAIAGLTFGKGAGSNTDQNFDDPSASLDVGVGVGTVSIGDASSSESSATVEIGPSLGADATVSKSFTLTGNDVKQAAQEVKSKIEELIR